jgi:hypothetical protein
MSSSPVAQYVVGGTTFGVATFKLATQAAGTQASVRELRFTTTGTDAIESITVGGVTAPVISGGTTKVTGLNLTVSYTGTDVPVTVKYSGFQNSTAGGSLQTGLNSTVTLTYVEASSGSGAVITNSTSVPSNTMTLVASKPTVTVSSTQGGSLILGAENKVGEFTVSADANGKISLSQVVVNLSGINFTSPVFSAGRIADGNTTISNTAVVISGTTATVTFSTAYEISAGQSKTFSLYANVAGTAPVNGGVSYVASSLTAGTFLWNDVIGGDLQYSGTNIINFPTTSYTTQR